MKGELLEHSLAKDPLDQFQIWFKDAEKSQIIEPNSMILSTVSSDGKPSARTVLLREIDPVGFVFYTNYQSRKGKELEANPNVAAVFVWNAIERQVRIEGAVSKLSTQRSDAYFTTRPRGAQIGAHASAQSSVLKDRAELERTYAELEIKFKDQVVPRPKHWGGYLITPSRIEFWQGRPSRLSDRLVYLKDGGSEWRVVRLAP